MSESPQHLEHLRTNIVQAVDSVLKSRDVFEVVESIRYVVNNFDDLDPSAEKREDYITFEGIESELDGFPNRVSIKVWDTSALEERIRAVEVYLEATKQQLTSACQTIREYASKLSFDSTD